MQSKWMAVLVCGVACGFSMVGAAETIKWIPAAASNPGAFGSQWTTDLRIYSPVGDSDITVYLSFFPDTEGIGEPVEIPVQVEPFSTLEITDVVAAVFGEHRPGAIRLRCEYPFDARSRTLNAGGETGVYGQGIASVDQVEAFSGAILVGATNVPGNQGTRTNIGIVNPCPGEATVFAVLTGPAGASAYLGNFEVELGPHGWWQGNPFAEAGLEDSVVESASITLIGGAATDCGFIPYLSSVDNGSGDGTFERGITTPNTYTAPVQWTLEINLNRTAATIDRLSYTLDGEPVHVFESPTDNETLDLGSHLSDFELCVTVEGRAEEETGASIEIQHIYTQSDLGTGASHGFSRSVSGETFGFEVCQTVNRTPVIPE